MGIRFFLYFVFLMFIIPPGFAGISKNGIIGHGALSIGQVNAIAVERAWFALTFRDTFCEIQAEYHFFNYGKTLIVPLQMPVYCFHNPTLETDSFSVSAVLVNNYKTAPGKLNPPEVSDSQKLLGYLSAAWEKTPLVESMYYTFSARFDEKQPTVIKISYRIPLFFEAYGDGLHLLSNIYSYMQFLMDFTPLSAFGDGTIGELKIYADARTMVDKSAVLIQTILPQESQLISWTGAFSYTVSNAAAESLLPLYLSWDISGYLNASIIQKNRIPYSAVKKCVASSILNANKEFSLVYLFDNSFATAWSENKPGLGEGEWIEITLAKDYLFAGIAVAAGYLRSEDTYTKNAAPVKIKTELFLPGGKKMEYITELPRLPYDINNLYAHIRKLAEPDNPLRVDKIRITVLVSGAGKKFENTCISELYILGGK